MRPVFIHLLKPCVMLPLINWCFPVVSLLERIRSFPLQLFFVQLVNVIFIPISICVILLRRACGWEVLPKLYCRAKKMNGTQLPWQELNLCRMVNFRKYGMTKTVRSRIMWRPISVGSFFRWAFAPQRADLIRLMPVPCHI